MKIKIKHTAQALSDTFKNTGIPPLPGSSLGELFLHVHQEELGSVPALLGQFRAFIEVAWVPYIVQNKELFRQAKITMSASKFV